MQPKTFIHQLHAILQDSDLDEWIYWSQTDSSIFILKPYDINFSTRVLKRFFKHGNVSSFVRQLHMYGFHKLSNQSNNNFANSNDKTKTEWSFNHPTGLFYKDADSKTLNKIQRKTTGLGKDGKRKNILSPVSVSYINPDSYPPETNDSSRLNSSSSSKNLLKMSVATSNLGNSLSAPISTTSSSASISGKQPLMRSSSQPHLEGVVPSHQQNFRSNSPPLSLNITYPPANTNDPNSYMLRPEFQVNQQTPNNQHNQHNQQMPIFNSIQDKNAPINYNSNGHINNNFKTYIKTPSDPTDYYRSYSMRLAAKLNPNSDRVTPQFGHPIHQHPQQQQQQFLPPIASQNIANQQRNFGNQNESPISFDFDFKLIQDSVTNLSRSILTITDILDSVIRNNTLRTSNDEPAREAELRNLLQTLQRLKDQITKSNSKNENA